MTSEPMDRAEAEELIYREALLIDERRFDEWLELFHPTGLYWVPAGSDDIDPTRSVSIIYDNAPQRAIRVERLNSPQNWSQDPVPRVRHLVSNVLLEGAQSNDHAVARSNQLICHTRGECNSQLPAHSTYLWERVDGRWFITMKKVCLLASAQYLDPQSLTLL